MLNVRRKILIFSLKNVCNNLKSKSTNFVSNIQIQFGLMSSINKTKNGLNIKFSRIKDSCYLLWIKFSLLTLTTQFSFLQSLFIHYFFFFYILISFRWFSFIWKIIVRIGRFISGQIKFKKEEKKSETSRIHKKWGNGKR